MPETTLVHVEDQPYVSLYRRYRPQRFSELLGQEHVVRALQNAVREQRVGHAYLFSGPRGTGKTSVARILAKALNCTALEDGEPCGSCESCVSIREGTSLDVHELDAASNNGVDAMRELVARTVLGTPGRWKVYIVDEVHMLSTAASNALLKTLEEPPSHVIFVLATTDPQKVLPTIRSRTQHFEFRLLSGATLSQLVRTVNEAAGLQVPSAALDQAVRRGRGSARDTLSVLDQVAAAGVVDDEADIVDELLESIAENDTARALSALGLACANGRDPQGIALGVLEGLRNVFLTLMGVDIIPLADQAVERANEQARRLGAATITRAMDRLGVALGAMKDSPDPRVVLEVALVHLTREGAQEADLAERVKRLEQQVERLSEQSAVIATPPDSSAAPAKTSPAKTASSQAPSPTGAHAVRQDLLPERVNPLANTSVAASATETTKPTPTRKTSLGAFRRPPAPTSPQTAPSPLPPTAQTPSPGLASTVSPPASTPASDGVFPSRDRLIGEWGDAVLEKLSPRARARFRMGMFLDVAESHVKFALPNSIHRDRCEELRVEVEGVLRAHFGVPVPLTLVVDAAADPSGPTHEPFAKSSTSEPDDAAVSDDEEIHLEDTVVDVNASHQTPADRILRAFPGAEVAE